jgi:putative transcriptional regulator
MFLKDLIYSNNVHDLRKDRNISQNKMAEDLGVSRRTISKIENCDQNLSLEMAYRISAYFNLLIPEVFPLTEKEK